ncbi:hypothetical protein [Streptomyces dengpaensis]|uniref:Uncharacterized protein n=2 Tax=Streptomyces TaxID=1883 RepID=A0ABN5HUQ3_9ACTN|nr:hypothetical protein [Streptomyces dengpaensis]AVH54870.1 hypothetical protein C4B68_02610 [Streptomyces dengpaensis]PIB03278.1 hypothetical protein B1C81_37465 [Streptomyces sp. HG99]
MHEKLLSKIVTELLHPRHDASHTSEDRSAPAGFELDPALVSGFTAGSLDAQDEAALADQVAELLPFHWVLPNTARAAMTQVIDHLGGQRELMAWLDRHPGLPRLVARLYVLMGLLDQCSAEPAVVTALREFRERTPYPSGLKDYLVPETDDETLATLAFKIEELLGDRRGEEAVHLALATATWLQEAAPGAETHDPKFGEMGELMGHIRHDIQSAAAGT